MHGFYRLASAVNKTVVANPHTNAQEVTALLNEAYQKQVSVVVFPELTLTGYTASDLFFNQMLFQSQNVALKSVLEASKNISTVAIIGISLIVNDRLYNCAVVIQQGTLLGIVPKSYLPNKKEFYEKRQFISG
ncbi:MAG TPA: NAD(+) synthase, partial [Campylobacterales bacterium]|nr:NAD(+) synthase [Campylobacterales bacterium]